MKRKTHGLVYILIGIMWLTAAIINVMTTVIYYNTNETLEVVYIILAIACSCLGIFYIVMGIKKRK